MYIFFFFQYDFVGNTQILFSAAGTGITDIGPDEPLQVITPLYFRNVSSVLDQFDNRYIYHYTLRIIMCFLPKRSILIGGIRHHA